MAESKEKDKSDSVAKAVEANVQVVEPSVSTEEAEAWLKKVAESNARLKEQIDQKVVSPMVLADILRIKPQMVYNYIRNNRLAVELNDTQKKVVPLPDAVEFIRNRRENEAKKLAKLERELSGAA